MNRMDKLRYFWIRNNPWVKLPKYIYSTLRCKMFGYPNISYTIDKMMFKSYSGSLPQFCHPNKNRTKENIIEVDKSYIKHDKLRKIIPKGWRVFKTDEINDRKQEVVYISKDDIDYNNDTFIYSHVRDYELDKRINDRRFMKNKNYEDILPQCYILTCKEDEENINSLVR